MYKLPHFTEQNNEAVIAFMKEYSFAVITGMGTDFPVATQIPLFVEIKEDGKIILSGHLMKNTDHHKAFEQNENVLVIFPGPHTYVSASWYTQKNVASTWNYMSVHAKGKIKFLDEAATYQAVKSITEKYEGPHSPASFHELPEDYVSKLVKAIVGFKIEVISYENVFKLSQNHGEATRESIISHLSSKHDTDSKSIAEEMEKRLKE